jgi:capsular polysaccharide transport system permease protein
MTEPKLNYIGALPKALGHDRPGRDWLRRLPVGFLLVVVLPTLIAAIYFLAIASPRYVSEAQFVVRGSEQSTGGGLGVMLQGVGVSSGSTDAFAVHEYIKSRDGLRGLMERYDMSAVLGPRGVDVFSRFPRPWEADTFEGMHKGFQRFITVGYDSATGISVLRVEAFRPQDSQAVAEALLESGEGLVNRLNERAAADAVADSIRARSEAEARLALSQQQLTAFRNREQFVDPSLVAAESSRLIGELLSTVAVLRAERSQIVAETPASPQLPIIDGRIRAYEAQIVAERAKIAGDAGSLAPRIGVYEELMLARELANREVAAATAAVINAEQQARRQKLYLDRVVNPNLPETSIEPRRLLSILAVFASAMLAYGIGWLLWAGLREHRQD